MIFQNFCHFEAIFLGPTLLDYLLFQWFKQQCVNYKIVAFCFGLHRNQCVVSTKRCRESWFLLKTFFQMKLMCCQWKKTTKSRNNCQLSTTIWMYSQITYLFYKFFSKQNLKNEVLSTTWKFPNVNRNATSLVVRLKTARSPLQKEQQTLVLQRLTSAWSQQKLCHVFHRQNLKSSHSDFLHVWSKFNVLLQFAKTLPKAPIKVTNFSSAVCRSDCSSKNFFGNKLPYWCSLITWSFLVSLVLYTGSKHTSWGQFGIAITLLIQSNTRHTLQSKVFRSVFWYIVFVERRNILSSFAKEPLEISLLRSCGNFCHMKFFWYLGRRQTWNLCNINQTAPATK